MKPRKTDNSNLPSKVFLRRMVLELAHFEEYHVLDLCAGAGLVWSAVREELPLTTYTPCDIKPRMNGCIKGSLEPQFLARFDLTRYNIIDIDTYGEPWEPWCFLAQRIKQPTAIFLTHGHVVGIGGKGMVTSMFSRSILGIPHSWPIPNTPALAPLMAKYALADGFKHVKLVSGYWMSTRTADYYGMLVERREPDGGLDGNRMDG